MKLLTLFFALFAISTATFAQDFTQKSDSDPAAQAILTKMRAQYESYSTVTADFTLIINIADMPEEKQSGKLIQKGNQYRLNLESQVIMSDDKTLWVWMKDNEEVQINCVEEMSGDGMLSPKDLMTIYDSGDYVYFLTNETQENGLTVQQIEFKPIDRESEYHKLRMTIDKKSMQVKRIKAFAKDGSRFTFRIDKLTPNKAYTTANFQWQTAECPDCYVEDLRMDCN